MPKIEFEGQEYLAETGESVLDCLIRHGVSVNYGCKSGVCQSCMMLAMSGHPTGDSQAGLKDSLRLQNFFLICTCVPDEDMVIQRPDAGTVTEQTKVLAVDHLNPEIVRLRLQRPDGYEYYPGQFLNFFNPNGVSRSYSLASVPGEDDFLELHIRRIPGGQVSDWAYGELKAGDSVTISQPTGDCFYLPGRTEQALLLIGTGTGLAPLYGILREALRQGHNGPIHLYHGSRALDGHATPHGLYLIDELRQLAAENSQLHYHPCVSSGTGPEGMRDGRANELALADHTDLAGWRIFLCGQEEMVKKTKQKAYLAGASLQDIYADPFVQA
jgi:CDP-4-dehydro-6-deoxyglucose reductase